MLWASGQLTKSVRYARHAPARAFRWMDVTVAELQICGGVSQAARKSPLRSVLHVFLDRDCDDRGDRGDERDASVPPAMIHEAYSKILGQSSLRAPRCRAALCRCLR